MGRHTYVPYLAHRAVAAGDFLHTFVSALEVVGEAHVAPVTVEVVAPPAHLHCRFTLSKRKLTISELSKLFTKLKR